MELLPFTLRARQGFAPAGRQVLAGAIDVEGQHRQRRAIRIGFAAAAAFRRAFQRRRNPLRIAFGEDAAVEIERVAFARHPRRPAPAARPASYGFAPGRFTLRSPRRFRRFPRGCPNHDKHPMLRGFRDAIAGVAALFRSQSIVIRRRWPARPGWQGRRGTLPAPRPPDRARPRRAHWQCRRLPEGAAWRSPRPASRRA